MARHHKGGRTQIQGMLKLERPVDTQRPLTTNDAETLARQEQGERSNERD